MSEDSSDENSSCRVVPDPTGTYGYVIQKDAPYQSECELLRAKLKVATDGLKGVLGVKRVGHAQERARVTLAAIAKMVP